MKRTKRRLTGESTIPTYTPRIELRSVDGHLVRTRTQVWAWYRLAPQRWSFRADAARTDLIAAIAGQYAELAGRWLHLRVTTAAYPISRWARAHVDNARHRPADIDGGLSFDDYMIGEQHQLATAAMTDKEVYLGVEVQTRRLVDRVIESATPSWPRSSPRSWTAS
ncbi:hypothetical protein GCM10029964_060900 [Kibdelosporangium lantanae]